MEGLKSKIEAVNEKFMERYKAQDMKGVAELYTEDCKVMPPGSEVLFGREAAEKMFGECFGAGMVNLVLKTEEVGGGETNNFAFERGCYIFSDKKGKEVEKGKFLIVWKCVSGQWHLYTDMFSANK